MGLESRSNLSSIKRTKIFVTFNDKIFYYNISLSPTSASRQQHPLDRHQSSSNLTTAAPERTTSGKTSTAATVYYYIVVRQRSHPPGGISRDGANWDGPNPASERHVACRGAEESWRQQGGAEPRRAAQPDGSTASPSAW